MLNDIAVRPFLEQPAREDALPLVLAMIKNNQLHECAGFWRRFPLGCSFASTKADHRATNANTLAGLQRDVPDQAIALVKEAEHRNPILHGSHPGIGIISAGGWPRLRDGPSL